MNKLITNKITLTVFFVILCQLAVTAQDSVKRVIVVVRPGGITKPVPASASTSQKATTAGATGAAGANVAASVASAVIPPAATTGAVGSTGSGTSSPAVKTTAVKRTPYVAPNSRPHGYIAPSTSERTGPGSYVRKTTQPAPISTTPAAGVAATGSASTGNASKYAAAAPAAPAPAASITAAAKGKNDTVYITKIKRDTVDTLPKKHTGNKIAFLEIGGPGLAISANYDMRFKKGSKDGFGFRIGAGYFASGNNTVFTAPLQVNYLYGKDGKYLELGIGTTFVNSKGDNYSSKVWEFDNVTGLIGTAVIGVRYEPNKALNFRLGYVPILYDEGLINAGGFSIGYTF